MRRCSGARLRGSKSIEKLSFVAGIKDGSKGPRGGEAKKEVTGSEILKKPCSSSED